MVFGDKTTSLPVLYRNIHRPIHYGKVVVLPYTVAAATKMDSLTLSDPSSIDKEREECDKQVIGNQSRALRDAMEDLFEHQIRTHEFFDEEMDPFDEQFIMLVSQYPEQALQKAVLMTFDNTSSQENNTMSATGRLPIHLACDTNAPIQVIRWLLAADTTPKKQSILKPDKWGDLPIHTACSRRDLQVIELLLENDCDKRTIFVKDNHGMLPLHMACRYNAPKEIIQLLLDSDRSQNKKSLSEEGIYGQLPIHIACRCNAPPDVVQVLLEQDVSKSSVAQEDNVGRLPIHVYLLRNSNQEVIQLLLEAMICQRIQRVGLENWKHTLQKFRKSMATHERDFNTREKLDIIEMALNEMEERAFVLELVIWKSSCISALHEHDSDASVNMRDICCQYKRERRIKSGAEVIIPGVLPFLENEPIQKLVLDLNF